MVTMTFLRDVGIGKIVDGFKESFSENGIKAEAAPYSKLLDGVKQSGDVKEGQIYYAVFSGDEQKAQISFQTNGKEYFVMNDADNTTLTNILKIWFGKPADSGLEELQKQFLKP